MKPGPHRILVIEDDASLRRLVRRWAERKGLSVIEAMTSTEALAAATVQNPDLILLDLHLPDGSGFALLARLKADPRTTSIPVVVWSGGDAMQGEAAALRAGASAYVEKAEVGPLIRKIVELVNPS